MKRTVLMFAFLAAAAGFAAQNHPQVMFAGDYADPSILRDGEDYWFTYSSLCYSPGLEIWHSKDLVNWEFVTNALEKYECSVWAPDIAKVGDKFYIYYPASVGGIFVVTADRMEGPWSEPVKLEIPSYCIDPGHVVGEDGKRYIFTNGGMMYPLSNDGLRVVGEGRQVYQGWEIPKDWKVEGTHLESPKLFKRGEWFYLVSAEGGTAGPATSHMCIAARSKSVFGPWENSPYNPFVHTFSEDEDWWSIGHGTLVDDPAGNLYCVYHGYKNGFHTLGRFTLIEELEWTSDGWFTPSSRVSRLGSSPSSPVFRLSSWKGNSNIQTLKASGESYAVESDIELLAVGAKGGLLLFYDENHYAGVLATKDEIEVYSESWEKRTCPNRFGKQLHIRLVNDRNGLTAFVNGESVTFAPIDVSALNHNRLGQFISLRPATWASEAEVVRFQNIKYSSNDKDNIR